MPLGLSCRRSAAAARDYGASKDGEAKAQEESHETGREDKLGDGGDLIMVQRFDEPGELSAVLLIRILGCSPGTAVVRHRYAEQGKAEQVVAIADDGEERYRRQENGERTPEIAASQANQGKHTDREPKKV